MPARIKQISESNIFKLYSLAKAEGKESNHDIALWIISVSVWWRKQGYTKITTELEGIIDER